MSTYDAAGMRPRKSGGNLWFLAVLWLGGLLITLVALIHSAAWLVAAATSSTAPTWTDTLTAVKTSPGNPVAGYASAPGSAAAVYVVLVLLALALVTVVGWLGIRVAAHLYALRTGRPTRTTMRDMGRRRATRKARATLEKTALGERLKKREKVSPLELVVGVGSLRGFDLYAQHEDSFVVIAPPRSGKTTCLVVPWILDAPGPVVATGTKNDVVFLTAGQREKAGRVDVLDFSGITGWSETMQWDPVAGCEVPEEALERGKAWVAADPSKGRGGNSEFFTGRAGEVLAYLFHAAALKPGGNMEDVVRWAADFDLDEPVTILREQGTNTLDADPREAAAEAASESDSEQAPQPTLADFGTKSWADLLTARTRGRAGETTDSLRMTLSGVLAPLTSPKVLRAVCPPRGTGFDIEEFLNSSNTLYLMSGKGATNAAPLITTLTDVIVRTAQARSQSAPGGRLSPPLRLVLEEATQVAPLPDLSGLMADSGGRGITTMVIAQSYARMVERWGRDGADAILGAATTHLYLPGIKEKDLLKDLSDKTDRYRARRYTHSSGGHYGGSMSTSSEWENVMTPEDIRQMPVGDALLVYRSLKGAQVQLGPYWKRPDRRLIEQSLKDIERRTGRKLDP